MIKNLVRKEGNRKYNVEIGILYFERCFFIYSFKEVISKLFLCNFYYNLCLVFIVY